ncbi:MAG TPA: hypothetical protein VGP93_08945 [Polyangiaceae bacterium]|nr:hypothetical protein [Polyangiaceae bacterium]
MTESSIESLAPDVARDRLLRVRAWAKRFGPLAFVTAALGIWSVRRILQATGGEPAAPLDDTFIHFQYARSFAELSPLHYTQGALPAPGATSLLWPLLLALPYALGLRGLSLLWAAWAMAWTALGLLAHETHRAGDRLLSRPAALAAGAMVLAFGGYTWFASSGMEVVPLAWLLMRSARRAADFAEAPVDARSHAPIELLVLAWLAPAMRPEGAIASLCIALTIALRAASWQRIWALAAVFGTGLPGLVNRLFTGQWTTTTAQVKWLPLSPYQQGDVLIESVRANIALLFDTLLDGRIWSAAFLPSGIRWIAAACIPALLVAGFRRGLRPRALLLTAVALGMLIPTSYDSFLWNRLRYLWPFAAAWFVGAAALADGAALLLSRIDRRLAAARSLLAGGLVGALAGHLPFALDDVAESANAIRQQQVALGRWAAENLPPDAVIGVNDTGAIAYFSERRVFDVVGLTTRGEARYWVAGAGSRFEHYERLSVKRLPTHLIVYPEWFALPMLQGEWLTERRVPGASILGGETMVASQADWSALGSGDRPLLSEVEGQGLLDSVDVADLESESDHDYQVLPATQGEDVVITRDGHADGARRGRSHDVFELVLAPGGLFVARLEVEVSCSAEVRAGGETLGELQLIRGEFGEYALRLPTHQRAGRQRIEIVTAGQTFAALHYWSFSERAVP